MKIALVLSLLLNLGVIGAVTYRVIENGEWPSVFRGSGTPKSLTDYLDLSAEQRRQWAALEARFLADIKKEWRTIQNHREAMIREIFSDQPDRSRIERERAAIAQLQSAQQRRTIEQLLRERDLLSVEQRSKLAELLLHRAPASTFEERLHAK